MSRLRRVAGLLAFCSVAFFLVGCSEEVRDPLQLKGRRLIVENQTDEDWTNVTILLNRYFQASAPSLKAHGRLDVTLDSLVSGYGQKFDFGRIQIKDLRVQATGPNGKMIELVKGFSETPLKDAFGGKS